jgi:hypothetical protein
MRWLFFILFSLIPCIAVAKDTSPPEFTQLKDALSFLDQALDADDQGQLNSALYPPLQTDDRNRTGWTQLKHERGKLRLVTVFASQEFPSTGDTFILAASHVASSPILMRGWSRIKFIKSDGNWYLNAAYDAR